MSWELSRRRGWLKATSAEQALDWKAYCFENGLDCIVVSEVGGGLEFEYSVGPDHTLSELAYLEFEDLMRARSLDIWSVGADWRGSSSQLSCRVSGLMEIQELVDEVRTILRRDRTSRRAAELMAHPAPVEGMAVALHVDRLWEGHDLKDAVYVLETVIDSGRCVVFKHLHPPLVDLPLEQFRILASSDT